MRGKPLFKKRTRSGRQAHKVSASETLKDDEASAPAECLRVDELVSLRDMLRKPTGIDLERLNVGNNKRQKTMDVGEQTEDHSTKHSEIASSPSKFVKANTATQDAPLTLQQPRESPEPHSKPEEAHETKDSCNAALLSSVPEVDLGLQPRLENIEATEKAKRALMQRLIPTPPPEAEPSTLDEARRQALHGPKPPQAARKERASDDRVYKRFRQRIQR